MTPDEIIYAIFAVIWLGMVGYLAVRTWRNRGKLHVRVKTPLGEETHLVKRQGNKVPIISGRGRRAEWAPTFTDGCLYQIPNNILWIIPRKAWCLDVKEDAEQCVDWHKTNPDPPNLTKTDVKGYARAEVLQNYKQGPKMQIPMMLYLAIFASIAMSFIVLLVVSGRLRI